jgi:hypothetical protein
MIRILLAAAALTGLLLLPGDGTGASQPEFKAPKPGPEHKALEPLVGTFTAKAKFYWDPTKPPQESTGKMTRQWIMDGLYLQEKYEGKVPLGKTDVDFKGMGITTYDPQKKQYIGTWIDSLSSTIMISHGTYDAGTKTFTSTSEEIDPMSGKKVKARDVLKLVDNDHHVFEMFRTMEGQKEFKVMEIQLQRASK